MGSAQFRFFGDLNDFLPDGQKHTAFSVAFRERPSVKHLIEALGVPHPEVAGIWVNAEPVDFLYLVRDGDQVDVYSDATAPPGSYRKNHHPAPRFVLDNHLGKLAAYLRLLGFDVLYRNDYQDDELASVASYEKRILLTRDRRLLMRSQVEYGFILRSLEPDQQLLEVLQRYNLYDRIKPFQRCLRCNTLLQPVSKEDILDRLEPLTRQYYNEFSHCPACDQVYWKGSHYERIQRFLSRVLPGLRL